MLQIRAQSLYIGQYIWFNDRPVEVKTRHVTPKGRIDVGFRTFEPEQKITILDPTEARSLRLAKDAAAIDTRPTEYKEIKYSVSGGNLNTEYVFHLDQMTHDEESRRKTLEAKLQSEEQGALRVGELIEFLSKFDKKDKILFNNDGEWRYLEKDFDWLLTISGGKPNL